MPDPRVPSSRSTARSSLHPLVERVSRFIAHQGLLPPGASVVVGVSGGPDSLALLHLLLALRSWWDRDLRLHVVHLDHGLRGAASAADAAAVAELAAAWGLPATVERREVEPYREAHGLSLEQAAREVRYRFFAEVARRVAADRVAVGHTSDDQVETVLLHIIRGTGPPGLRGMLPAAPLPYAGPGAGLTLVRPLLEVARADTEDYCRDYGLPVRQDPTNMEPTFLRNRVRLELLPVLERYNPQVRAALLRLAGQAAEDQAFLEQELDRAWSRLARVAPGRVELDLKEMALLHRALQKHAVRRALTALLGDLQAFALIHIEEVVASLSKPVGTRVSLPRGVQVVRDYRETVLSLGPPEECPLPPLEGPQSVPLPGELTLPGWVVRTRLEEARQPAAGRPEAEDRWRVYLDADAIPGPWLLRTRQPGDRFQPLGLDGTKKLQDFFVDARIPRVCRDRVPLLVAGNAILWVVGWRIDHRARLTAATRRVVVVECRPKVEFPLLLS